MATPEQLQEILQYINMGDIDIPNLYQTPYIVVPTLLGSKQYFFEYYWNNRNNKAYLTIYTIENEKRIYFIKNVCLIRDMVISDKIYNINWNGVLKFQNKNNINDISYTIKDISEKFKLFYCYSEE